MRYSLKSCVLILSVGVELVSNISCGKAPTGAGLTETGGIEIQVQLSNGMENLSKAQKTGFDTLVVEVTGDDIEPIRCVRPISPNQLFLIDTLPAIPTGSERKIKIHTVNQTGMTVHEDSCGERTLRVEPGIVTVLQVVLVPVRGSIYLQIGSVPTNIDSLGAIFTADNGTSWTAAAVRNPKVFLSIDNIPDNTHGILNVAGFTIGGDTLYRARNEVVINSRSLNNVRLSFEAVPGGLALSGSLQLPGATLVSSSMGSTGVAENETGVLIISEIMYAANDSEYVEVYNPSESSVSFDSLYLEIDGSKRLFAGVAVAARSYYVFGRQPLPWADAYHTVKSALDLSPNGNWISVVSKDGTVFDQVVFTGGSNQLEWPRIIGKTSICLQSGAYSSLNNNFGRNWVSASTPIEGAAAQMGTPHLR